MTILKNKPAPRIKNVEKAVENLKWYVAANSGSFEMFDGHQIISKKDLARMIRISRPTLDKWIRDGFIQPEKLARSLEIFPIDSVLEQLEKQRNKK